MFSEMEYSNIGKMEKLSWLRSSAVERSSRPSQGQITIPTEFGEALGINAESVLRISLVGDHLEVTPLRPGEELRRYT